MPGNGVARSSNVMLHLERYVQEGGVFDTQARCCASGSVDACGVCDGIGDSCRTNAIVDVTTPSGSPGRRLVQTGSAVLRAFFSNLLKYDETDVTAVGTVTGPLITEARP